MQQADLEIGKAKVCHHLHTYSGAWRIVLNRLLDVVIMAGRHLFWSKENYSQVLMALSLETHPHLSDTLNREPKVFLA